MQSMNDDSNKDLTGQPVGSETGELSDAPLDAAEETEIEKELNYQKAVNFMDSLKCMAACKDKAKMYKKVAAQFEDLSGYKDSELLMKKCKRSAKKVKEEIKKNIYERALYRQSTAKSATDYKLAAEDFRSAAGYLDADERAEQCEKLHNTKESKGILKIFINWGITILVVVLLICVIIAPLTKYITAEMSMKMGHYNYAATQYEKLGKYKDSEGKYTESRYQEGLRLEKSGSDLDAEKLFAGLGDYKDSSSREAKLEKRIISKSKIGDTVTIAGVKWSILDIKDSKALLLRKKAQPGGPYAAQAGNTTWENSELRKYLNTEYLSTTFSEQERKNICLSVITNEANPVYKTDGGADTKDYIFALSISEIQKYASLLPTVKMDIWLRTPGNNGQSAAFLSVDKAVMDYGYDVTSDKIFVLPAMWYDFSSADK